MDLLASLKKLVEWQRVVEAAARVPDLERRIAALERQMPAQPSHPACPKCGVGRWRVDKAEPSPGPFGALGARDVHYSCTACDHTDMRVET